MITLPFDPIWAISIAFIFSLCVGSFLNVVIHRLPLMMEQEWSHPEGDIAKEDKITLSYPPSTCPQCQHRIRWYENIPLISYLLILRGRCSSCAKSISLRYPFVELLTGVAVAYTASIYGLSTITLAIALLTWFLISLIFIDIDHQLLPDRLTLPLLWLGLLVNSFDIFTSLESAVYGAMAGYLSLWSVYWAFKLLTGKEGMGYGDFKLLAALGAWVGLSHIPLIILLSSVVGASFGIAMIINKKLNSGNPIPFGPYLAIAGWIALLWGDHLIGMYLRTAGL